ncbi:hypothetical protein EON65_25615 [archaeon]|nr:MAG: hypothetical protein EON65_25615 [archaeon]
MLTCSHFILHEYRYIEDQFRSVIERHTPGKGLPIHVVAARVRRDMKMAFGEVKDTLKKNFQTSGGAGHSKSGSSIRKVQHAK